MRSSFILAAVLTCLTFMVAGQALPRLKYADNVVVLTYPGIQTSLDGLPQSKWHDILSVYTHDAFVKKVSQPVAGVYTCRGDSVVFKPIFPFAPGGKYHAIFSQDAVTTNDLQNKELAGKTLSLTFEVAQHEFTPTSIESVYPESALLPENLLRMYICFSGPMMTGEAFGHIHLFDHQGKKIERAFLVIDQELWDQDRKRLTLLFDAGRIKRGLKANLDLGPPLTEGETYHLVIDSTWRDMNGSPLLQSFHKKFTVTEAQRSRVSAKQLHIVTPPPGTTEALIISFDRLMDHALVSKFVAIRNASSLPVDGVFKLNDDRTLSFLPSGAWQPGHYTLTLSPLLEDVAGNNFNNPFDLDLTKDSRNNSTALLSIDFVIKSQAQ